MGLNRNIYPQSGYVYYTLSGAKLVATSWDELAKKLQEFKKLQGQNISEEEAFALIEEQVCQREPLMCRERRPVDLSNLHKSTPGSHQSHVTRALAWLRKKALENQQRVTSKVDQDQAESRAEICFKCPLMSFYVNTCSTCSASLHQLREAVLFGTGKPYKNLGFCKLTGEDLGVAVWLDEEPLKNLKAPSNCWRCK